MADAVGPPDLLAGLLDTTDAAKSLRVSPDTLKRWRRLGSGPPVCRIGGRVFYSLTDLRRWIEAGSPADL